MPNDQTNFNRAESTLNQKSFWLRRAQYHLPSGDHGKSPIYRYSIFLYN